MDLINKLPYFYDNGYTRPIIDAEQTERDILVEEIADVLKQMYVSTATWGLDYWEEMLYLPKNTSKTYEERRSIIYTRMRSTRTTTVEVVKELASAFFGAENVIVTEYNENYSFNIEFENIAVDTVKLQDVINVIDIYKPAHLNYDFTFSTKTNMQINSSQRIAYSTLPICGITLVGTWWKMYADGFNNGGKVIQSKSYNGYSKLPICGVYKNIIKLNGIYEITTESAVVGSAVVGSARVE